MKGQEQKPSPERERYLQAYFSHEHHETLMRLQNYGLSDIELYRSDHWYIGDDGEGTIRRYYAAQYHGQPCFVKLAQKDSTIQNEIYVNDYLTKRHIRFVPQTLLLDYRYGEDASLLVTEFKAGLRPFVIPESCEKFIRVCREFEDIYTQFAALGVVHGDISESNLLLDTDGSLVVTDFGIGHAPGTEQFKIDYGVHDGTYYQTDGNLRTYDDIFSFLQMLNDCGLPAAFRELPCYRHLESILGKHQFQVILS